MTWKNVDRSSECGYDLQLSVLAEQIESTAALVREHHLNIWSQGESTYRTAEGGRKQLGDGQKEGEGEWNRAAL